MKELFFSPFRVVFWSRLVVQIFFGYNFVSNSLDIISFTPTGLSIPFSLFEGTFPLETPLFCSTEGSTLFWQAASSVLGLQAKYQHNKKNIMANAEKIKVNSQFNPRQVEVKPSFYTVACIDLTLDDTLRQVHDTFTIIREPSLRETHTLQHKRRWNDHKDYTACLVGQTVSFLTTRFSP